MSELHLLVLNASPVNLNEINHREAQKSPRLTQFAKKYCTLMPFVGHICVRRASGGSNCRYKKRNIVFIGFFKQEHNITQHSTTLHNTTQHNSTQLNKTQHKNNTTQDKTRQHKPSSIFEDVSDKFPFHHPLSTFIFHAAFHRRPIND
ncbi:hypothetical protein HELRODRAFT_168270 [Helobdella robusta]|uniref:Uncharacterized protein n=1 Tax=Helobdella robusta TaxID=6412 RepID=T1F0D6_HELRO|nr:hypothetical protein HELRODRAFT_168270 [Helobdella robusta]ESO09307.1 hypothetical protein HELRODRAFT_168270 [Helobdella robusta]